MKLYDFSFSPYSSRVRIMIRAKKLPVEIAPPPFALKSDEFKARFPLGKIPVLELDDGTCLAESWVIMEYLEDLFPETPLRPMDPLACAQMRLLGRIADLHLSPAFRPLFSELLETSVDAAKIPRHVEATRIEILKLGRILDGMQTLDERALDLGDIALATTMYFVDTIPPIWSAASPVSQSPAVARWWDSVRQVPAISLTMAEIDDGFRGFLKQIGRT
ncbi:MAG: glutathione S-transferase family protein [Betaproteobacteria bacterium]|nr:glutathione S-transferase family protein [Betaproteobacteria bacterium]